MALDYNGLGDWKNTQTLENVQTKVFNDPELKKIYDQSRVVPPSPPPTNYNFSVVPLLLAVRRELNDLIDEWPRNIPIKDLTARIDALKAQERQLVAAYTGHDPFPAETLTEDLWPEGAMGRCWKCGSEREVGLEELKSWISNGTPKCKRCGVKVTIK